MMSTTLLNLKGKDVVVSDEYFKNGEIIRIGGTEIEIRSCWALPDIYDGWIYSIKEVE